MSTAGDLARACWAYAATQTIRKSETDDEAGVGCADSSVTAEGKLK
jgi:hypothetical protein